jgi:NADH-quinone oxidoreductase subunit L
MALNDIAPLLIYLAIGLPWVGALLVWIIGDNRPRWQHITAIIISLMATVAALLLLLQTLWYSTTEVVVRLPFGPFIGDMTLIADGLSVFLTVTATTIGCLAVIFSAGYMASSPQLGRYYALVLLFIGSMCGLVLSGNLLFLFLFWEATAFCSYALISFHNDDPKAVSAGIKALIVTQLGGVGLLLGVLVVIGYLPDLQVSTLLAQASAIPAGILAITAFGFLLAATAKSAQVPLHIWLPDAMEAPTPVSALIHAATMVNAGVYLLARFYPAFTDVPLWAETVVTLGLISAALAALMAVFSNDLKRILAYSTVSQLGFMVVGVGIGAIFQSQFYLMSHAIFKALLFLCAGAIIHEIGTRDIREMGGLWTRLPQVGIAFVIGAAALAGLPFFNGFWSKELLIEASLEYNSLIFGTLVVVAGITGFYAFRMCWMVFLAKPALAQPTARARVSYPMMVPLIVLAVGTSISWLFARQLAGWFSETMPFHTTFLLQGHDIDHLLELNSLLSLTTGITLIATVAGILLSIWFLRKEPLRTETGAMASFIMRLENIFNTTADGMVSVTLSTAAILQKTQTGQLNWNIVAIVMALISLLAILIGIR